MTTQNSKLQSKNTSQAKNERMEQKEKRKKRKKRKKERKRNRAMELKGEPNRSGEEEEEGGGGIPSKCKRPKIPK